VIILDFRRVDSIFFRIPREAAIKQCEGGSYLFDLQEEPPWSTRLVRSRGPGRGLAWEQGTPGLNKMYPLRFSRLNWVKL